MRRTLNDFVMSIGAATIVLAMLIVFDSQLRDQVAQRVWRSHSASSNELVNVSDSARAALTYAIQIVKLECKEHLTLMLFVVSASVLTLFMIRV